MSRTPASSRLELISEETSAEPSTMAQELKPFYLDQIPEYSGEPELLANFIEVCEELIVNFYDRQNPDNYQNKYFYCKYSLTQQ